MESIKKSHALRQKLDLSDAEAKEIVRLLVAAATQKEERLGDLQLGDCYKDAGLLILNHCEKTPENFQEAIRLLSQVEEVHKQRHLPNWFHVYDDLLIASVSPASFGFDPSKVSVGSEDDIKQLAQKMVRHKGHIETLFCLSNLLNQFIFKPFHLGHGERLSDNTVAVAVLETMIAYLVECRYGLEISLAMRGILAQYCKPKTRENFDTAVQSYQKSIASRRDGKFYDNGAIYSFVHLIDLLERPEVHGFTAEILFGVDGGNRVADGGIEALGEEAAALRSQRDEWYKTDPTRRLACFEIEFATNQFAYGSNYRIALPDPTKAIVDRALFLGKEVLDQSNNNLIRQRAATAMGLILHNCLLPSDDTLRQSMDHYKQALGIDVMVKDALSLDLTYVGMPVRDRREAGRQNSDKAVRTILRKMLPICFFPENYPQFAALSADLEAFKSYIASLNSSTTDSVDLNRPLSVTRATISSCYTDYVANVSNIRQFLSTLKNPGARNNAFVLANAEQAGAAMLGASGCGDDAAKKNNAEEMKKFEEATINIDSFYDDPTMADFYGGFSSTLTTVLTASLAVDSGMLCIDTGNPAVSGIAFLLSMVPVVGGVLPTIVETGYSTYMSANMRASARKMVKNFPAGVGNTVSLIVSRVQKDRMSELHVLDKSGDLVVAGLIDRLVSVYSALERIVTDGYPDDTAMEKIGAQVANALIKHHIYQSSVEFVRIAPSKKDAILAEKTLELITTLFEERLELIRASSSKKGKTTTVVTTLGDDGASPANVLAPNNNNYNKDDNTYTQLDDNDKQLARENESAKKGSSCPCCVIC